MMTDAQKTASKRYRESHREKRLEYDREYKARNKSRHLEYSRDYYNTHKDVILNSPEKKEYGRLWRKNNSEALKAYHKDRYRNNKAEYLADCKARYDRNKTSILAKQKKYYQQNRDSISIKTKAYTARNALRNRAKAKLYAQQHPERVRAYKKKWQDAHKHEGLMRAKARRAKMKISKEQQQSVSEFYRWIRNQDFVSCTYCGTFVSGRSVHIDHIIPVSRGGEHSVDNFCVSCHSCNLNKSDLLLSEWPKCPEKFKHN